MLKLIDKIINGISIASRSTGISDIRFKEIINTPTRNTIHIALKLNFSIRPKPGILVEVIINNWNNVLMNIALRRKN